MNSEAQTTNFLKFTCDNEEKISESLIVSYSGLLAKTTEMYNISTALYKVLLYKEDEEGILNEIVDDKTFEDLVKSHKGLVPPKLVVFKEPKNVDDIIQGIQPCDSFIVPQFTKQVEMENNNPFEINQETEQEKKKKEKINIEDGDEPDKLTLGKQNSYGQFSLLRYSDSDKNLDNNGGKFNNLNEVNHPSIISCDKLVEGFYKLQENKADLSNFFRDKFSSTQSEIVNEVKKKRIILSEKALNEFKNITDAELENLRSDISKKLEIPCDIKSRKEEKLSKIEEVNIQLEKEKSSDSRDSVERYTVKSITFNVVCSFCQTAIHKTKYVCLVCTNVIMCELCEDTHEHPTLKLKTAGIANKLDALNMLTMIEKLDNLKKEEGVFNKFKNSIFGLDSYKAKLWIDYQYFTEVRARPNKRFVIPISIANMCKNTIPQDTTVIVRNFGDMYHETTELNSVLGHKEIMQVDLLFEAYSIKNYEIEVFLFHSDITFEQDILKFKVVVNEDTEEEEIDEFLRKYPKLRFLSKKQKMFLKQIKQENISDKDIMNIYFILEKHKWNIDDALDNLTSD